MQLEKAKQLRDNNRLLIGQKAKDLDANIFDVIVVPDDNLVPFISEYRMYTNKVSNDEMLLNFPSKSFSVKVIYDIDPEFVDIYHDDISLYIDHQNS
jgi:hypothetical protein